MLSGKGYIDQCGHNDFQVEPQRFLGYLIIATASEECRQYFSPGSHHHVWCHPSRKVNLAEALPLQEFQWGLIRYFSDVATSSTRVLDAETSIFCDTTRKPHLSKTLYRVILRFHMVLDSKQEILGDR